MNDEWLTTHDAAQLSGYDVQHVRRLARNGKIQAKKWGKEWMIHRQSLLEYIETEGRKKADPPS